MICKYTAMSSEINDQESNGDQIPAPSCAESVASSKEEDGFAFHLKLPADGLALRSIAVVDGVPEISFDASRKVPTITEEDVATAFRLASEGVRPEFFYNNFPFLHPFFGRQFKRYLPQWLRGTSVGELLSDADWTMKCLHIGARSNKDKSAFWAWEKTSQLEGLATRLDFPEDNPPGSIKMSCESAKVQKDENEMVFPEEPKMRIVDDSNSLYSKYITEMLPSIAYDDEPLFLRMQELIKLILAAEWFKEKGVRVSRQWMMEYTARPSPVENLTEETGSSTFHQDETKRPPKEMVPQPAARVMRPRSDMTVQTLEAEQYRKLAKFGIGRRYGWHDFGSGEMIMFEEDGTRCQRQQSLKILLKQNATINGQQVDARSAWLSLPLPPNIPSSSMSELREQVMKLLPQSSHQEFTGAFGRMLVDITVESHAIGEDGADPNATKTTQPTPPLALPQLKETTTMKASVNDYNVLYGDMDPNQPIWPEIPGLCEEIIPNIGSWNELFNETVPRPHVWQVPYIGIGEPAVDGGVTTRDIPVREEPIKRERPSGETAWVDQYKKRGSQLVVRAQWETNQGTIRPANEEEFAQVAAKFRKAWRLEKGPCPSVDEVFVVTNRTLEQMWNAYKRNLRNRTVEEHFHGTTITCNITATKALCNDRNCGICGISSTGFDTDFIRNNIDFQRFGNGFYLAPNSSKCHDYTKGAHGVRAMLLCDVCPGRKYQLERNSQQLKGPPPGYDSVYGQVGCKLNYPEIVVYNPDAVKPRYIILYRKDGVKHPLAN